MLLSEDFKLLQLAAIGAVVRGATSVDTIYRMIGARARREEVQAVVEQLVVEGVLAVTSEQGSHTVISLAK